MSPKRRDRRQMTFIPDAPIFWAEAKNHPPNVRGFSLNGKFGII